MPNDAVTLMWFRRDLRLADNPALAAAAKRGRVVPVFIWSPDEDDRWKPGAASRWWLHHSLCSLRDDLAGRGHSLVIRRGRSLDVLRDLVRETGATSVHWNRCYEPDAIARDSEIKRALRDDAGIEATSFNGSLLHEPWAVLTKTEKPYQVFTPYYRTCLDKGEPESPMARPNFKSQFPNLKSLGVEDLDLLPKIKWDAGFHSTWKPGEAGVQKHLARFIASAAVDYPRGRDLPAHAGTSRLSPHLHFGEISPRQIWHATKVAHGKLAEPYQRQLVWREFAHQLLYHFPHTSDHPLRGEFRKFPWARDDAALKRWQKGTTGYPIVDAGMRELWATGWMHNRVRMIVASFLVKHLLIPWQHGAAWFWDTLVDADLANNSLGWQWAAGCGADAAPYFRIFNPSLQGEKFDSQGEYIRRWVPELRSWPDEWLHHAAKATDAARKSAGYPPPIIAHEKARARALAAWRDLRAMNG